MCTVLILAIFLPPMAIVPSLKHYASVCQLLGVENKIKWLPFGKNVARETTSCATYRIRPSIILALTSATNESSAIIFYQIDNVLPGTHRISDIVFLLDSFGTASKTSDV